MPKIDLAQIPQRPIMQEKMTLTIPDDLKKLLREIRNCSINELTPVAALLQVEKWQKTLLSLEKEGSYEE